MRVSKRIKSLARTVVFLGDDEAQAKTSLSEADRKHWPEAMRIAQSNLRIEERARERQRQFERGKL